MMVCNVGVAKPVLLECKKVKVTDSMIGVNKLDDDVDNYEYFSLDLKNNEFYSKGWGEKTKGTCSLGSCEKYSVWEGYGVKVYELPYRKESAEHLYLGREWKELPESQKAPWRNKAKREKELHKLKYPNISHVVLNSTKNTIT